ncbi:Methyltransferase-related [Olea europaea subsp. europaea]|uniref:Methyltransferase-related n=1 Tax=Olea europaea subsp. europaea TaxID=158383 RepID=A0A8S0PGY0_OLEEU|nr:Methyltransferase-related [Olea europaea subsp. europaea]
MCPLRIILIFLSATLAGFFVLRNLKAPPINPENDDVKSPTDKEIESPDAITVFSKVCGAIRVGGWTFVEMASGSYLWRNLVSSSTSCTGKHAD